MQAPYSGLIPSSVRAVRSLVFFGIMSYLRRATFSRTREALSQRCRLIFAPSSWQNANQEEAVVPKTCGTRSDVGISRDKRGQTCTPAGMSRTIQKGSALPNHRESDSLVDVHFFPVFLLASGKPVVLVRGKQPQYFPSLAIPTTYEETSLQVCWEGKVRRYFELAINSLRCVRRF